MPEVSDDPAKTAANAAEARAEESASLAVDRLNQLNGRLFVLRDEIKALQLPIANGAICLELYQCGPGCGGCPHPRWMQYFWKKQGGRRNRGEEKDILQAVNLSKLEKEPGRLLKSSHPNYRDILARIREAKAILEERSELVAVFRSLHPFAARAR